MKHLKKIISFIIGSIISLQFAFAQLPSFPGAEGFGAASKGGRGGAIMYVTNLNNSGSGSFRAACEASGPRTVIFRIGGTIFLNTTLKIENPFITIAGQTAPGDGITLRLDPSETDSALEVLTNDVVIRHIRIRPGPASVGECCRDAITFLHGANNVMVDHCSFSWATDETVNAWYTAQNITIQNCIVSEALKFSSHSENGNFQNHSMGALFGDDSGNISLHHNLFAHNNQRNPLLTGKQSLVFENINNLFYNYGAFGSVFWGRGTDDQPILVNHIGNFYKPGTDTKLNRYEVGLEPDSKNKVYIKDNIGPHRLNESDPEWNIVGGGINYVDPASTESQVNTPFLASNFPISIDKSNQILNKVTSNVGATLPKRDSIDKRIIKDVNDGTGKVIDDPSEVGGWVTITNGTPYIDTDKDGMDDIWENQNNLNSNNASDRNNDNNNNGYTNLEEFLNETNPNAGIITEDIISSIDAPNQVSAGNTYSVEVAYSASTTRDVVIIFQQDTDPFTNYVSIRTPVNAGQRTLKINIPITTDIPIIDNAYQWNTYIVNTGGKFADRFSGISEKNIDVVLNNNNPQVNKNYWRLENKATEQWIRTLDCSGMVDNTVPLILTPTSNTGNCTMFEFTATDNGYYRMINKATGGRFKPQQDSNAGDESIKIVQVDDTYAGWLPQWKLVPTDDGYYRLENRKTEQWIRSRGCNDENGTEIVQVSQAYTGDCTKWKLVNAGIKQNTDIAAKNLNSLVTIYPNPAKDIVNVNGNNINRIEIYSALGALILKENLDTINAIDISNLSSGLYFIKTYEGSAFIATEKLIIKN